jgi:acetyl esterase/lipase
MGRYGRPVADATSPDALDPYLRELAAWAESTGQAPQVLRYGDHRDQVLDLRAPAGPGPHPLALVLHGGFWRAPYTRAYAGAIAVALTDSGWATANVEYRRLGPGAYRPMLDDVLAARERLRALDEVDAAIAVGHSAGGHLALWLAAQGAVRAAVALAGVCDLKAAADAGIGSDAVAELLGGAPAAVPDAYDEADPARRLPLGLPQLLVHGTEDDRVPIELARTYAERARAAGDDCRLVELDGADHFDVVDPRRPAWAHVARAVADFAAQPSLQDHPRE